MRKGGYTAREIGYDSDLKEWASADLIKRLCAKCRKYLMQLIQKNLFHSFFFSAFYPVGIPFSIRIKDGHKKHKASSDFELFSAHLLRFFNTKEKIVKNLFKKQTNRTYSYHIFHNQIFVILTKLIDGNQ